MHDDQPVPKVIDFGVSKALSRKLTDKTVLHGLRSNGGHAVVHEP